MTRRLSDNVQGKQRSISRSSGPTINRPLTINRQTMDRFRPALKKFYYDQTRYATYLEQLGIAYLRNKRRWL